MKTGVPTLLTNHAGTGFDGQKLLFTTTTAGRLLVSKPLTAAFKCTEGGSLHFFLTVDGVAVRGSALPAQSRTNITDHQYMMLSGVTAKIVPAGNHTLGVGAMCNAGIQSGSGWSGGVYSGTVVVVGG